MQGLMKPDLLQLPRISGRRLGDDCPNMDATQQCVGEDSPVPTMPNLMRHSANVPGSSETQVAGNIVTHVDDLLGALAEMHEVNKFWKDKYMQSRAEHINKYVPGGVTRIIDRSFHCWKGYVFEMGNVSRLQRLKHSMSFFAEDAQDTMDEREAGHQNKLNQVQQSHESKAEQLAAMIQKQNQQCKDLLRERDYYASRDDTSTELLKGMRALMDQTPERAYAVGAEQPRAFANDFEYTKSVMHDILNEIDPKYVPPIGSLGVPAPPNHLRLMDGKSIIQQLGMDQNIGFGAAAAANQDAGSQSRNLRAQTPGGR